MKRFERGGAEFLQQITKRDLPGNRDRILVRVEPHEVGATMDSLRVAVGKYLHLQRKMEGFSGRTLILHTRHDGQ